MKPELQGDDERRAHLKRVSAALDEAEAAIPRVWLHGKRGREEWGDLYGEVVVVRAKAASVLKMLSDKPSLDPVESLYDPSAAPVGSCTPNIGVPPKQRCSAKRRRTVHPGRRSAVLRVAAALLILGLEAATYLLDP